jgi:3-dehydroquinate synthetase
VGGKTGVNSIYGKNLIGSFYQPSAVFIDTNFLNTLPNREMRAGYAEIFKYGLIQDIKFMNWLLKNGENILKKDKKSVIQAVYQSCKCKSLIVSRDEKENNIRAILNFGHTFGHVIEQANEYKNNLNHGESVAIGIMMALKLCVEMKLVSQQEFLNIQLHFQSLMLPIYIPRELKKKLTLKKFLNVMSKDKKASNNNINLILLNKIGKAYQTNKFNVNLLEKVINSAIK